MRGSRGRSTTRGRSWTLRLGVRLHARARPSDRPASTDRVPGPEGPQGDQGARRPARRDIHPTPRAGVAAADHSTAWPTCRALFWQSGGGFDRNVNEPRALMAMIDYIHLNPVRRGLVARRRTGDGPAPGGTKGSPRAHWCPMPSLRSGCPWVESSASGHLASPACNPSTHRYASSGCGWLWWRPAAAPRRSAIERGLGASAGRPVSVTPHCYASSGGVAVVERGRHHGGGERGG